MRVRRDFKVLLDGLARDRNPEERTKYEKGKNAAELGMTIAEKVGWEFQETEAEAHHFIEIEVFPTKAFKEFEKELMIAIDNMSDIGLIDENQKTVKDILYKLHTSIKI